MADTAPVPLASLFAEVDDPRRPQARLHALEDILLMATLAVICDADSWTEVELFGRQKRAWLETFLELPHGIPSHDTFARLDPQQLERCFTRWVQSLAAALQAQVVSVDGKAARRSHDADRGLPPLHLVGAWADQARLVLGQRRVDDHSNEITAIPELLAMVLLRAVRSHWGVENRLHWVLDMAFREDESRIRTGHAAHNLSILRRLALNLLRRETTAKGGIAARRKQAAGTTSTSPGSCQIGMRLPCVQSTLSTKPL